MQPLFWRRCSNTLWRSSATIPRRSLIGMHTDRACFRSCAQLAEAGRFVDYLERLLKQNMQLSVF
jgi:hypothetical protein